MPPQQQQPHAHGHRDAGSPGLDNDPQVLRAQEMQDPKSLCDVVCAEMLGGGRNPERPIISRMVVIGEIANKDDPPRQFFEDCINTACQAVNSLDPTGGRMGTETIGITGLFVEMQEHFYQLVESEPAHLLQYAVEVETRVSVRKTYDAITNLQILFVTDDVVSRAFPKFCYVDANLQGKTTPEQRLEDLIVDSMKNALQLGSQLQTQGKMQMDSFLSTVKNSHPQLLPKVALVQRALASGLCLTLEEYCLVFAAPPSVSRSHEVLHPVDPPLDY